jgi:hypothetical protein
LAIRVSFISLVAALLLVCLWPACVLAQGSAAGLPADITMTERVGFAFYSLTKQSPPLEDWVMGKENYQRAQPNVRLTMMDSERNRLHQGWSRFNLSRDLITLRFAVRVRGMDNPDLDPNVQPRPGEEILSKAFQIELPGMTQGVHFPFQLGRQWITVIPEGMTEVMVNPLTDAHYKLMVESIGLRQDKDIIAEAELVMRPKQADGKTPMTIDSLPMFLMLADIASFSILDKERRPIWEISADWYKTEQSQEFLNLYKR